MAHKFNRTDNDPYAEATHQVEDNVYKSYQGLEAGASEDVFGDMANAIVTALGDIGAEAFRLGINTPDEMKGLAKAISACAESVLLSYEGEVAPQPVIKAIADDPRRESLTPVDNDQLTREIEKTGQLEQLLLSARRLQGLIDLAASLGLRDHEDAVDQGTLLVPGQQPTGPGVAQVGERPIPQT